MRQPKRSFGVTRAESGCANGGCGAGGRRAENSAERRKDMATERRRGRNSQDEHCRKIDFFIAGLQINGTGLGEVAKQIADGGIAVCGATT